MDFAIPTGCMSKFGAAKKGFNRLVAVVSLRKKSTHVAIHNKKYKTMSIQLEQAKKTAGKFARRTLWIVSIGLLVFMVGYYVYRTYTISEGTRTGTLFKISKKGVMFKTYEGQLHLGGSAVMTQQSIWDFSAANGQVYDRLQQFEGKTVKCHYKQMVNAFPWQGDTDYIVYDVEAVTQ